MFYFLYHYQDFDRTWLFIWVTRRVSYKKQELLTLHEHLSSPTVCWSLCFIASWLFLLCVFMFWVPCCDVRYDVFMFWVPCCDVRYDVFMFWVPCCDVRYDVFIKRCLIRPYLRLFVWGLISYLRYLCLFVQSGVQHILCCVFVLFFFALLPVSQDCLFLTAPSVFSNVYLY